MSTYVPPPPPPPPARSSWVSWPPIEGEVYDLMVSGDEAVLRTSNGVLRYRVRGLSVKYLRLPPSSTWGATVVLFMIVFMLMLGAMFMNLPVPGAPFTGIELAFQTAMVFIAILFIAVIVYIAAYIAAVSKPRPVLVVIDHAGVEHYYRIVGENRDRIISTALNYAPPET